MSKIIPVILSGGSGTRLWPLSRKEYPKQYLPIFSENTMLQETLLRLHGLKNLAEPIIVCNEEHRFLVAEQCKQIGIKKLAILLEPVGRNTAPALSAAALEALNLDKNPVLLVLSADHFIQDVDAFHNAVLLAEKQAISNKLVTFGVKPTEANIGYGYIKKGQEVNGVFEIDKFTEKPNLKNAIHFIKSGNYLWNAGMFMFKAKTLLKELYQYSPEIINSTKKAVINAKKDLDFVRLEKNAFKSSPDVSIDYALMEKSKCSVMIPLNCGWSDVGSWSALYDIGEKGDYGNVIKGDVISEDTKNSFISASHHLVAAIGVENLIIIDTPDVTFIASKDKTEKVKNIVKYLKDIGRVESESHRKVYRPWGWYDSIESGNNFQVKKLHVNVKSKLSLQLHHQRDEHWVVIKGTATVINGESTLTLKQGDSTYIPRGFKHSLENRTNKSLEIIEVQSGSYLGEDDIIRFEDIYGRAT